MTTRRTFLSNLLVLGAAGTLAPSGVRLLAAALNQDAPAATQKIFTQRVELAHTNALASHAIGDVMAAIGRSFIGSPYEAHTLEVNAEEQLVTRLDAFDCVSFVENVFAITLCIKKNTVSFDDYCAALRTIRYRNGVIAGYPSRLHYFTDWVRDNEKKMLLHDVTRSLGGIRIHGTFNFMSTHPESYKQLEDAAVRKAIEVAEKDLSLVKRYLIPRESVAAILPKINNGDIIALGARTRGIDFSHTGLAVLENDTIKFLHAPLSAGSVQVSTGSLAAYLDDHHSTTGILVARPIEPA